MISWQLSHWHFANTSELGDRAGHHSLASTLAVEAPW